MLSNTEIFSPAGTGSVNGQAINPASTGATTPGAGYFTTLSFLSGAAVFTTTTSSFGGTETTLTTSNNGNSLAIKNLQNAGAFSAISFRGYDDVENGAIGMASDRTVNYWESSDPTGTSPPPLQIWFTYGGHSAYNHHAFEHLASGESNFYTKSYPAVFGLKVVDTTADGFPAIATSHILFRSGLAYQRFGLDISTAQSNFGNWQFIGAQGVTAAISITNNNVAGAFFGVQAGGHCVLGTDNDTLIIATGSGPSLGGSAVATFTTSAITLASPAYFKSYAKASLPSAGTAGGQIFVTDATPQPCMAFSDGTNWRSVVTGLVIA